jgi:hypothetical protein
VRSVRGFGDVRGLCAAKSRGSHSRSQPETGGFSSPAQSGFTYGGFLDRIDTERSFPVEVGSEEGIQSYTAETE